MNKQSAIYTIVFTFIVSFAFVSILAFANQATAERVEQNQRIARQRAFLNAIGIPWETEDEILDLFGQVEELEIEDTLVYRTEHDGHTIYAKEFSGQGLWGTIRGVLALREDLETTAGIEIIDHEETPGLGGRITEQEFKEQFRGRRFPGGEVRAVQEAAEEGEIAAITGATGTTNAMERILSAELDRFRELLEGSEV